MDAISVDTFELESEFKEQWEAEIKRLTDLSTKIQNLHVKCLYCQTPPINKPAKEAWTAIVKKVSASSGHWRELGMFFELAHDDLDYIEHSVTADKTDTVLQLYMHKYDNATLDKVTDALAKMKRYDVLKAVEEPLLQISQHFYKGNMSNSDTGYHSRGSSSEYTIITPKNIPNTLPEVLKSFDFNDNDFVESSEQNTPPVRQVSRVLTLDKNKPILLLTFAADGKAIADDIPRWTRSWSDESLDVQVVTLNERRNEVQQNPEIVIRELIQEADYIVPILTEGYLKCITSKDSIVPNSTSNLDIQYARYIYNQLLHKYTLVDCCFNKNVRSILPQSVDNRLTVKFGMYPELLPWTCEVDFDATFKDLIKIVQRN